MSSSENLEKGRRNSRTSLPPGLNKMFFNKILFFTRFVFEIFEYEWSKIKKCFKFVFLRSQDLSLSDDEVIKPANAVEVESSASSSNSKNESTDSRNTQTCFLQNSLKTQFEFDQ